MDDTLTMLHQTYKLNIKDVVLNESVLETVYQSEWFFKLLQIDNEKDN